MSMRTWILSMKLILVSAGIVSLAVGLKFSIPIAVNGIPAMWSVILSWMKPPYLYLIINCIIITIAATSRFHQSKPDPQPTRSEHLISVQTPPVAAFESFEAQPEIINAVMESQPPPPEEVTVPEIEDSVVELNPVMVNGSEVDVTTEDDILVQTVDDSETEDVIVDSMLTYNTPPPQVEKSPERQLNSCFPVREKPPVSSRFVNRKPKLSRSSPEVAGVNSLRVAKPKKQETLESTWKMITEGRHVPLTRHLKKSDTWEHHVDPPSVDHVVKSETFKDRSNYESPAPPPPAKIKKEPSLSQDELNRRVEAFITKFNEDMRMQRQESLNQYKEMISRGV